jgi:hypothetical protein
VRYEVTVSTPLVFHTKERYDLALPLPGPEDVVIEFEGRRFVWHATHVGPDGEELWPTVTVMVADADNYGVERGAMMRFLSTLSFHTGLPIEVHSEGASPRAEMARPMWIQPRSGQVPHLHLAPLELVVGRDDDRLQTVLGYYRDGQATESGLFRFLAFYNALEVACEDYPGRMQGWLLAAPRHEYHWVDGRPADLWDYLQEEGRHAVAHAIRDPARGVPDLNPNDPAVRARFHGDSRWLSALVRDRVEERWGPYAVWGRPRPRDVL